MARAKREGYRSRAAYKLIEIDDRHKILKTGAKVIDLGAAPGGWSQVAAQRVKAGEGGRVVAIDLLEMEPLPNVEFMQMDFLDAGAPKKLRDMLGEGADVVLSDMAANTTGHRKTDQLRIIGLVEEAAGFAREVLKPGGAFLAKVRQGGTDNDLLAMLKRDFATVKHIKPLQAGRIHRSCLCWRRGLGESERVTKNPSSIVRFTTYSTVAIPPAGSGFNKLPFLSGIFDEVSLN